MQTFRHSASGISPGNLTFTGGPGSDPGAPGIKSRDLRGNRTCKETRMKQEDMEKKQRFGNLFLFFVPGKGTRYLPLFHCKMASSHVHWPGPQPCPLFLVMQPYVWEVPQRGSAIQFPFAADAFIAFINIGVGPGWVPSETNTLNPIPLTHRCLKLGSKVSQIVSKGRSVRGWATSDFIYIYIYIYI